MELNNFAWLLLTVGPAELRDPGTALALASKACDKARADGSPDLWMLLDTLAIALHETGSNAAAVTTQREALRLMPAARQGDRPQLEAHLREYELAAGGG